MGKIVNTVNIGTKTYDVLNPKAFKKLGKIHKDLKFENLVPNGGESSVEVFYDTPLNLLTKTGILLSKVISGKDCFFKVAKMSFIPKSFRLSNDTYFIHEVGMRDKLIDHSLYVIDGITSIYGTNFNIDLENVFKTLSPILEIKTKVRKLRLISGTGFRANLDLQEIEYHNFLTKRKVKKLGMVVTNDSTETYLPQFDELCKVIQKECKEFVEINENRFDYAVRLTKKIEPKPKTDMKKQRKDDILNKIEG